MSDDTTIPDSPAPREPGVQPIEIQTEMEQSFLDYAMSVIVSRALPDVRDGLKPVHRRILWAMHEAGLRPDRPHRKCATVVGDVIGKYHPHGDQSVYDALVRMGQDFSLRHVLIDKHGNFGSPSDPPAAYRYTECRLAPLATHMLAGIDEDTVDMVGNFDSSQDEPTVLPSRFPNLLVNGSQGIAVGMATNIPPHNLGEVIDATLHLLDHPEATVEELMEFVKGPDFPTGGQIMGRSGILSAYRTGRGSVKIRAKAEIVDGPRGEQIVVTEIPYQTSVDAIAVKAAELVSAREIEGIRDIRNESSEKTGTRLVFDLKRDAPAFVILNNLFKHTPMQTSFAVNFVALVDGVPRTLGLRDALGHYVEHQREVIRRRSEYRLAKAAKRAHIVEGLLKAIDMIDAIIAAIRASEDKAAARASLRAEPFEFSDEQTEHILDMPLSRLTRLGRADLDAELAQLRETIAELEAILSDDVRLRTVIKDEMGAIRETFANPRRSPLTIDPGDLDVEDLIDDEELVVMMTANGYIKTVSADAFRTQGRGGRGVAGTKLKDEDDVRDIVHTTAHAFLLFFSNRGRVYRLKAHQIPMMERTARGTALVNLLQLQPDETIQTIIDTRDYETNRFLFFVTRKGVGKKTLFNAYDSSRQAGLIAINLRDDDELVRVLPVNDGDELMCVSKLGQGIRFRESDVRPMGRDATGVRAMRLRSGDTVVSADVVADDHLLLTITDGGFGKRTEPAQFTTQGRGGQGVRAMRLHADKGQVVAALMVGTDDELFLINDAGVTIRVAVADISIQGRDATGVRVMNLDDDTTVVAVARVFQSEATDLDTDADEAEGDEAEGGADADAPEGGADADEAEGDAPSGPRDDAPAPSTPEADTSDGADTSES